MDPTPELLRALDDVLGLSGRARGFTRETPLLGVVPELDSMSVVALISTLEGRFGFVIDDDEISGRTFASVGSLVDFVTAKLGA